MKCTTCGYDDLGTGDSAHVCGTAAFVRGVPQYIGAAPTLEAERAEFERVYAGLNHSTPGGGWNDFDAATGRYHEEDTHDAWVFWQAARTATPAPADVSLPLDAEGLTPLPQPAHRGPDGTGSYFDSYTAEQVRQAQRAAYEAGKLASIAEFQRGVVSDLAGTRSRLAAAQQSAQSIDTPEFQKLMGNWGEACWSESGNGDDDEFHWSTLIAYIDGRTDGTAPASLVECTQAMLEAAMKAAVAAKMFPPSGSEHTYLRYWYGMKASVDAALAAAPSPLPPQEEA